MTSQGPRDRKEGEEGEEGENGEGGKGGFNFWLAGRTQALPSGVVRKKLYSHKPPNSAMRLSKNLGEGGGGKWGQATMRAELFLACEC